MATLAGHVVCVIRRRSCEQVGRVAAGRVIASVANKNLWGNRPMEEYPDKSMCALWPPPIAHPAVVVRSSRCLPLPAVAVWSLARVFVDVKPNTVLGPDETLRLLHRFAIALRPFLYVAAVTEAVAVLFHVSVYCLIVTALAGLFHWLLFLVSPRRRGGAVRRQTPRWCRGRSGDCH